MMPPLIPHSHYSFPVPRTISGIRNMFVWDSIATAIERAHQGTGKHQQCCKQRYRTNSQNIVAILDQCKLFRDIPDFLSIFLLRQQVALAASRMTESKNAQFFLNNRLHSLLQKHLL